MKGQYMDTKQFFGVLRPTLFVSAVIFVMLLFAGVTLALTFPIILFVTCVLIALGLIHEQVAMIRKKVCGE